MRTNSPNFHAARIYAIADWAPSDPPGSAVLLERILGETSAQICHERSRDRDARLFMRDQAWCVLVPAQLEGAALAMALARVLARWYALTQLPEDVSTPDIDALAAAIALPDAAVPVAIAQFGRDAAAIASWLALPFETVAARINDAIAPPKSGLYPSVRMKEHAAPPESSR